MSHPTDTPTLAALMAELELERAARLQAEQERDQLLCLVAPESAEARLHGANRELLAQAEEVTSQYEELEAQREELEALNAELRSQNERFEQAVEDRTQELVMQTEELQTANEQLFDQAEALRAAEIYQHRRARHANLRADVGQALAVNAPVRAVLQKATEAIVRNLDAAFARIWTLDAEGRTLLLQASAGLYTHIDGDHARVPVGQFKIGLIAEERLPHLTNDVLSDPRVGNPQWARDQHLVSFAGYPLIVEDRLVGVIAMFSRNVLPTDTLEAFASVSDAIAQGIERKRVEQDLADQAEILRVANEALAMTAEELQAQTEELEANEEELRASADTLQEHMDALSRERNFIERLVYNLPGAVAYWDKDLVFRLVNPLYAKLFKNLPIAEYLNRHLFEVFPGTEDQLEADFRHVLETGEPWVQVAFPFTFEVEGRMVTSYWDFELHAMRNVAGGIEGVMALAFEVSTRIRLEQEMAEERALTERIFAHAPAGIAFLDGDLVFRRLNESYATLLDMTVEQIKHMSIFEVFPGATDQVEPLMRQVMETGIPYVTTNFPFRFVANGVEKQTYWDFTYQPMRDEHGRTGILILEVEVSDRQEKERLQCEQITQLKALDRYKDEFLSVISHELRTPLNFITGFASTLEDQILGPLKPKQQEAVSRILNGADRMLKLVDDLLDFAKIQSGRFELTPEPVVYVSLVEEVLGLLTPLADQKGLALGCEVLVPQRPRIDGGRVSQVLTNLVGNALKFTDDGGQVFVRSYMDGDTLVTEVKDSGWGIAPEQLPRLFHRFQQLDMSNTRKAGGTGLGLAISKAIVEAHGGTIGVTSAPGAGSTFWFRLPVQGAVLECQTQLTH